MSKHGKAINKLTVQRDQLQAALSATVEQRDRLLEALKAVQAVASNSEGIIGWHKNGEVATWDYLLPEVDESIAAVEQQAAKVVECKWTQEDDDYGCWNTDCGETFCINDGNPSENSMKFCHGCGKPIKEVPWVYPGDDD